MARLLEVVVAPIYVRKITLLWCRNGLYTVSFTEKDIKTNMKIDLEQYTSDSFIMN